jgi:hypothetical protein
LSAELERAGAHDKSIPRTFGPDLNILDYVFTPVLANGQPNRELATLNRFNLAVYDLFHVPSDSRAGVRLPVPIEEFPEYFLTKTTFSRANYGDPFMDGFLERILGPLGERGAADKVVCLRSVVMDPFMPYTSEGDFFETLIADIGRAVERLVLDWREGGS